MANPNLSWWSVRRERAKQRRAEWFAEQGDRCKWCRSCHHEKTIEDQAKGLCA